MLDSNALKTGGESPLTGLFIKLDDQQEPAGTGSPFEAVVAWQTYVKGIKYVIWNSNKRFQWQFWFVLQLYQRLFGCIQ